MKVKLATFVHDADTGMTTTTTVWESRIVRDGWGVFEVELPQKAVAALLDQRAKLEVVPE